MWVRLAVGVKFWVKGCSTAGVAGCISFIACGGGGEYGGGGGGRGGG